MADAKTGWASVGFAPITQDDIRFLDRIKGLGSGGGAERRLQAVASGAVANARAGVRVVVAERRADQLLYQVSFFVGAAR